MEHGLRQQKIKLGNHEYEVVAQRHAYLERHLGPQFAQAVQIATADFQAMLRSSSENYYDLLLVFIPDLMPKWEWRGYASQTAADADQYDKDQDASPTLDEMVVAFRAVTSVNRLDLLEKVKDLAKEVLGPDFFSGAFMGQVRKKIEVLGLKAMVQMEAEADGESGSESLQPSSGEPRPANGGTSPPISQSSGDGPTPALSTT